VTPPIEWPGLRLFLGSQNFRQESPKATWFFEGVLADYPERRPSNFTTFVGDSLPAFPAPPSPPDPGVSRSIGGEKSERWGGEAGGERG